MRFYVVTTWALLFALAGGGTPWCAAQTQNGARLPEAPRPLNRAQQQELSGQSAPQGAVQFPPALANLPSEPPVREQQQINQKEEDQSDNQINPAMFLHHLIADRYWISGQTNFIFQAHGPFHSPYAGPNSFQSRIAMTALSRVMTLYTGVRFAPGSEFLLDAEEAGGKGVGEALGIAAFTNLDVVRNPTLSQNVYLARYMLHETIPIGTAREESEPNPFSLATSIPARRIEFRLGKMSMVDFFDVNAVGSDSHLQFTNWAIDNNGAYDYAADTRGYTYAALLEYQSPRFGARYGEALMPTVANGITLDLALRRARADNFEMEFRPAWFGRYRTEIRTLAYLNVANMGDYREAIDAYLSGKDKTPDITLHRHQGTLKQGFGLNMQQNLPWNVRVFMRAGWNEGHHESFAYTEMNNTVALGADLSGVRWRRPLDQIGSAVETGGISKDHREYLALGGLGFILGDGALSYGRETVSETYYDLHAAGGLYFALQLSAVENPGYNRARGPVFVPGVRAHIDF
jgi:high affinity Mn2+ porin